MKTNNLKSLFIILIFIATQSTITKAQIYDTLYSYPDTTTFYNTSVIVVSDIVNLAITFHPDSSWESYQIEKILCSTPGDGVNPGGWTYFFLSVGDGPEDSIIYVKQVFNDSLTFYPEIHTFILDTPVVINHWNRFYFSGSFVNNLSISQFLDLAVPGQFAYWWSLQRWVEYVPYYFNLKVIVKKNLTSIDEPPSTPNEFYLEQNYPNPFNSGTSIKYHSPEAGISQFSIYNVLGKIVYQEQKSIGIGQNSFNISLSDQPTGVYFYKLDINNKFISTKKMILLK